MNTNYDNLQIRHNESEHRFETVVDNELAVVEYRRAGDQIIFTHTEVPEELEGRGIGSKLAQTALEYAGTEQLRVAPRCAFVAAYIREHPEYKPLVAPDSLDLVDGH